MNKTIVVEFGCKFVRAGLAGETNPSLITDSYGILEITDTQSLNIKLIELFQRIFIEKLVVKPKEYNILIVEKLSCSRIFRNHLLTILFTEFQVTFLYIFKYECANATFMESGSICVYATRLVYECFIFGMFIGCNY